MSYLPRGVRTSDYTGYVEMTIKNVKFKRLSKFIAWKGNETKEDESEIFKNVKQGKYEYRSINTESSKLK